VELVSVSSLTRGELHQYETAACLRSNPEQTLIRKIERLAHHLNCTEEEAENVFFNRL
jgi:hypothetical protein